MEDEDSLTFDGSFYVAGSGNGFRRWPKSRAYEHTMVFFDVEVELLWVEIMVRSLSIRAAFMNRGKEREGAFEIKKIVQS